MREFTEADVDKGNPGFPAIRTEDHRKDLVRDEPEWMKQGLQETATGYGGRLNSGWKISFNGRLYRIYATCCGNAASHWFKARGRTIYVS